MRAAEVLPSGPNLKAMHKTLLRALQSSPPLYYEERKKTLLRVAKHKIVDQSNNCISLNVSVIFTAY